LVLKVQPDVEKLVVNYLIAHADVPDSAWISTDIPPNPIWPVVTVQRIGGGSSDDDYLDGAVLQIDVRGVLGEREAASDLMGKIRAAMAHRQIVGIHTLGVVTGSLERRGPQYLPDPDTGRPRFTFDYAVWIHRIPS
jgi:hypothetical protein